MNIYKGAFGSILDLEAAFATKEVYDFEILYAEYDLEKYEGSAYILCTKDGKLFEVEANHCSCYELEGLWKPAEITKDYLRRRQKGCTDPLHTGYTSCAFRHFSGVCEFLEGWL